MAFKWLFANHYSVTKEDMQHGAINTWVILGNKKKKIILHKLSDEVQVYLCLNL